MLTHTRETVGWLSLPRHHITSPTVQDASWPATGMYAGLTDVTSRKRDSRLTVFTNTRPHQPCWSDWEMLLHTRKVFG